MTKNPTNFTYALLIMILLFNLTVLTGFEVKAESEKPVKPIIDRQKYEKTSTATFALGCFWGGDTRYGAVSGVIRTRVGYAGGSKDNPTYHDLGDHTESIQIDFNPEVISYEELVDIFWNNHNPGAKSYNTQYANILFYHNPHQKEVAEKTKREVSEDINGEIFTQIKEVTTFYPAEPYHQKYRLRQSSLFLDVMQDIYPNEHDLRDSTAAARLNGFLAGHGTPDQVEELAGKLGLTQTAREKLLKRFGLKGS